MSKSLESCMLTFLCRFLIACCLLNNVNGVEYYTVKPSWLPSCKIYKANFTQCSTDSIQKLIVRGFAIGIPEVEQEFGSLDPMIVKQVNYNQDDNEVATIKANLTDVSVTGFSKLQIKESKVSKKDFSWDTKSFAPKIRLDGKYKMNGRILLIPLKGSGNFFIEIDNASILMHTDTELYEKGDFTFYNVTKVRVNLKIKNMKAEFENIFNGQSKEVERSTNQFFNDNWAQLFEALKPVISETIENILIKVLQKIFHLIPANFFVEDIPTSKQLYGEKNKN